MQLQAAIAAGIVEPPKRARTRPVSTGGGMDEGGEANATPTSPGSGARAGAPLPSGSLPPGLTEEQLDSILTAISCGVTVEAACASVRVPRGSMYRWMDQNAELRAVIDDARDAWSRAHVEFIAQSGDWKARSWLLGVRLPKDYAPTNKVAGHDGGPLLADAELLELARRALAVTGPGGDDEG